MTMGESITPEKMLRWLPPLVLWTGVVLGIGASQFQLNAQSNDLLAIEDDVSKNESGIAGLNLFITRQQGEQALAIQGIEADIDRLNENLEERDEKLDQVLNLLIQRSEP